jgi:hypothetical protein
MCRTTVPEQPTGLTMASRREQLRQARAASKTGRNYYERELRTWEKRIVAEWAPGSVQMPQDADTELSIILNRGYSLVANRLLPRDWRAYKQVDDEDPIDEAMRAIAGMLAVAFVGQLADSVSSITNTVLKYFGFASAAGEAARADGQDFNTAARTDLARRLRRHRIIIAVTESNWTVNVTRDTAVLSVVDPLQNSVERIAALIESGDINGAKRLSREVVKLARLPTSVSEGELLRYIDDARDRLTTPLTQGRIVATMRQRAADLDSQEKEWAAIFHNTRPSHAAADGQRKPIGEPYQLPGGLLMYPMDRSFGADGSEIYGCQCESVYL